jgi:hypothetical protein
MSYFTPVKTIPVAFTAPDLFLLHIVLGVAEVDILGS